MTGTTKVYKDDGRIDACSYGQTEIEGEKCEAPCHGVAIVECECVDQEAAVEGLEGQRATLNIVAVCLLIVGIGSSAAVWICFKKGYCSGLIMQLSSMGRPRNNMQQVYVTGPASTQQPINMVQMQPQMAAGHAAGYQQNTALVQPQSIPMAQPAAAIPLQQPVTVPLQQPSVAWTPSAQSNLAPMGPLGPDGPGGYANAPYGSAAQQQQCGWVVALSICLGPCCCLVIPGIVCIALAASIDPFEDYYFGCPSKLDL